VVLKTKYDIETIVQNQDQLDTTIKNSIFQKEINLQNVSNIISEQENYIDMLPITNEDAFTKFEEKLSTDKTFKSNLVCFTNTINYSTSYKYTYLSDFRIEKKFNCNCTPVINNCI
jgi:hypothetical protein